MDAREIRSYYVSSLGQITMAAEGDALTGLWFTRENEEQVAMQQAQIFSETRRWLDAYFAGEKPGFIPNLKLRGTAFRKIVWDILCTVPYGETTTYGRVAAEAARRMGKARMSAQAAGGAVGHNPICLIIPCHRILGADGSLTGYAEGLWRKKALLELEACRGIEITRDSL